MSKMILGLVLAVTLGCGVKGPPEPPLPTEGSLKKELQQEQATAPQPETSPVPPKTSKKTSKTKAAKTAAPKTTDQ